jgi:hypothetical protein
VRSPGSDNTGGMRSAGTVVVVEVVVLLVVVVVDVAGGSDGGAHAPASTANPATTATAPARRTLM